MSVDQFDPSVGGEIRRQAGAAPVSAAEGNEIVKCERVKPETKTDKIIWRAVSQTIRDVWTTGWTVEDRQSCKEDAYQATHAWLVEYPGATNSAIQKQANRSAEKIRREFNKNRKEASAANPPDDYSGGAGVPPWDDIRIKGSQRPDWKKLQLVGLGSNQAVDLEIIRMRMATAKARPPRPYELTMSELVFLYDYMTGEDDVKKHSAKDRKRFERLKWQHNAYLLKSLRIDPKTGKVTTVGIMEEEERAAKLRAKWEAGRKP